MSRDTEPSPEQPNLIKRFVGKVDTYQRNHLFVGFPYALTKKYGLDNGSYLCAVITYYGLLSLFPLLIVFTAATQLLLRNNPGLRERLSASISNHLPVIGSQIQHSVHSPKQTGLALILSLLVTLYGARGGANALQFAASALWYVPQTKQPPFLKNIARSFSIILLGGLGLVVTSLLAGYSTFLGHNPIVTIGVNLLSIVILWAVLIGVFKLAIGGKKQARDVALGAAVAAVGLQLLQVFGSLILSHQLKSFNSIYGTFALVIGLMFWIYLQAEVVLYAIEIDVVRANRLFPRSIQEPLTEADKATLRRYTKARKEHTDEQIDVSFQH